MTGTDAGEHGIFGFVDLQPGSYDFRFPDFSDLRVPAFFDELGERGLRSIIINLPATYPARPIPGVLISGFISLELAKSVSPTVYLPLLKRMGYQVDADLGKGKDRKAEFLAELHCTLRLRREVANFLWHEEPWDVFLLVLTETDRLHHFLFDAYRNPGHAYYNEFRQIYREVDAIIGDLLDRIAGQQEFTLLMLSDHGFGPIASEVYINPILKKHRFFSRDREEVKELATIQEKAKAFALDPARIFVHRQGSFPRGKVSPRDYDKICRDLRDLFEEYTVSGKPAVKKAYFKEELYSPPLRDMAADLILLGHPGFDLKAGLEKKEEYGLSHFTGMHLQDNAFCFCSKAEIIPEPVTIFDLKRAIFQALA
jgi:predicted AlkP superfamily phosphohydrolase/phosphomutase